MTPTTQCTVWREFISQLDPTLSYNSITLSGTITPEIIYLNVGTYATTIVQVLHFGTWINQISVESMTWTVNSCGSRIEGNPQSFTWICSCFSMSNRYALYPCVYANDWSGLNGTLCSSPTQTITLTIQ